jgi:NADPH2:quinone reductase
MLDSVGVAQAVVYDGGGGIEVLRRVQVAPILPGPGEVRVRVAYSGVNPLDCKERQVGRPGVATIPHYDGSGWIDAVGSGVAGFQAGDRVWIFLARVEGREGTAQDYVVLPACHVRHLRHDLPLAEGACLGMPALTAYRCLTLYEGGPEHLAPGALSGMTVLAPGGGGAVGNAAIQLAVWAGARVLTTVRGDRQMRLATLAGADVAVDRASPGMMERLTQAASSGVDIVVEVDPVGNAEQSARLCAPGAVIAVYGRGGQDNATLAMGPLMAANIRYQWIRLPALPRERVQGLADGVAAAFDAHALRFGEAHGLPLHVFPLERVAEAHVQAQHSGAGKALLELAPERTK